MNKYHDKSDFEINKAVAIARGYKVMSCEESVMAYIDSGYKPFDPCNNPADAMPIINDYGISLIYQEGEFQFATNDGNYHSGVSNPLKAAMIVLLMMKEAENAGKQS